MRSTVCFRPEHHENRSQRDIGRQLMQCAAYAWARSEGLNLVDDMSVAFKYEARLVKNLYSGLRFVAQHAMDELFATHK